MRCVVKRDARRIGNNAENHCMQPIGNNKLLLPDFLKPPAQYGTALFRKDIPPEYIGVAIEKPVRIRQPFLNLHNRIVGSAFLMVIPKAKKNAMTFFRRLSSVQIQAHIRNKPCVSAKRFRLGKGVFFAHTEDEVLSACIDT